MSLRICDSDNAKQSIVLMMISLSMLLVPALVQSQTAISTGSIQGTIADPTGAIVAGAKVAITDKATNKAFTTITTSAGTFASGALTPGDYMVEVEAQGFKKLNATVSVQVGVTASGNFKLQLGQASQVV